MKIKITNLRSLRDALNAIPDGLLEQEPFLMGVDGMKLTTVEVTTEEFLVNKNNSDDMGYTSELKKKHGSFDPESYNIVDPAGAILIYIER